MPKELTDVLATSVAELEAQLTALEAQIAALESTYQPIVERLQSLKHVRMWVSDAYAKARDALKAIQAVGQANDIPW